MRYISLVLTAVILFTNGCASKKSGVSDKEYDRSNAASEKSLNRLDRE